MNMRSCPSLKIYDQGSRKKMTFRDLRFMICQSLEVGNVRNNKSLIKMILNLT
jgi:hypothetical protein